VGLFDAPKYASYIALCRRLRLEWTWRQGDYYQSPELDAVILLGAGGPPRHTAVPLPRLDQWLAMLEEAGWTYHLTARVPGYAIWGNGPDSKAGREEAGTPEEAAARLYCAVTGRPAPRAEED
jgi:hypothetical protein